MPAIGGNAGDRFEFEFTEKGLTGVNAKIKATEDNLQDLGRQARQTDRDLDGLGRRAKGAGDGLEDMGRRGRRAGSDTDKTRTSIRGLDSAVRDMGQALNLVKAPVAAAGVAYLAGAAVSAGGGVVALTSALAPLAGAVAAIPGAALAGGSALGVFKLATMGVADALKAMLEVEQTSGAASRQAAQQREQAAERQRAATERVRDATLSLRDAEESSADRITNATEQVRNAKERLSNAQRDALRAQQDLTQAREDARQKLRDLRDEVEHGALSEERAALNVERARQRLNEVQAKGTKATALDRREADLAYREAIANLDDVRHRRADTAREFADANRRGVNGSREVAAAQQRVADAARGVGDAQRDVGKAELGVRRAQREGAQQIARAQTALADAIRAQQQAYKQTGTAGVAAMDKVNQAMSQLGPTGQRFARFLFSLRGEFTILKREAENGFLPGLQSGIQSANRLLPIFRVGVRETAGVLGDLAAQGGRMLASGPWREDFRRIVAANTTLLRTLGRGALAGADGVRTLTVAAIPMTQQFADMAANAARAIAQFLETKRQTGELRAFFAQTVQVARTLGGILGDIGVVLLEIGKAAQPLGTDMLTSFKNLTGQARAFFTSTEGRQALADFFARIRPVLEQVGRILEIMARHTGTALDRALTLATQYDTIARKHPELDKIAAVVGEIALIGVAANRMGLTQVVGSITAIATKAPQVAAVGGAIGLIGAAAVVAYTQNETFRGSVNKLAEGFKAGLDPKSELGKIKNNLKDINTAAGEIRNDISGDLTQYPNGIIGAWLGGETITSGGVGRQIGDAVRYIRDRVHEMAAQTPGELDTVRTAINNFQRGFASGQTEGVTSFANNLGAFVRGLVRLPGEIARVTAQADHWLDDMANGLIAGVNHAGEIVHTALVGWFRSGVAAVKSFLGIGSPSKVFNQIGQDVINGFRAGAAARWRDAINWLKTLPGAAVGAVKAMIPGLSDISTNAFRGMLARGRTGWAAFTGWAKGIPGSIGRTIGGFGGSVGAVVAGGFRSMLNAAKSGWATFTGWARGIPGSMGRAIGGFGGTVASVIRNGFGQAVAWVHKFYTNIIQRVAGWFKVSLPNWNLRFSEGGPVVGTERNRPTVGGGAFREGGHVERLRSGGRGRRSRRSLGRDTVDAKLVPGEYVLNRRQVAEFPGGLGALEAWRASTLGKGGGGMNPTDQMGAPVGAGASAQTGGRGPQTYQRIIQIAKGLLDGAVRVVSAIREGARTHASGALSYHATGHAVDFAGENLFRIWSALNGSGTPWQELIFSGAPTYIGRGVRKPIGQLDSITRADHWDHVHAALLAGGAQGGIGAFLGDIAAKFINTAYGPIRGALGRIAGGSMLGQIITGSGDRIRDAMLSFVGQQAGPVVGGSGGGSAYANRLLGQQMAAQRGWTGQQWAALDKLVQGESGWNNMAQNPSSSAYGIFQFLNSTWASVGARKTSNPTAQIAAGLRYVAQRYGSPISAYRFKQSHNWYRKGGPVGAGRFAGGGFAGAGFATGGPVRYGTVSQAKWNALLAAGWRGRPGDRMEALYPPAATRTAKTTAHHAAMERWHEARARRVSALPDAARERWVANWGLPPSPPGQMWHEDFTLGRDWMGIRGHPERYKGWLQHIYDARHKYFARTGYATGGPVGARSGSARGGYATGGFAGYAGRTVRATGAAPISFDPGLFAQQLGAYRTRVTQLASAAGRPAPGWQARRYYGRATVSGQQFYLNDLKDTNRGKAGFVQSSTGAWVKGTHHQLTWRQSLWNTYASKGLTNRLLSYSPARVPPIATGAAAPGALYRPMSGAVPGKGSGGAPISIGEGAVQISVSGQGPVDAAMVEQVVTGAFKQFATLIQVRGV